MQPRDQSQAENQARQARAHMRSVMTQLVETLSGPFTIDATIAQEFEENVLNLAHQFMDNYEYDDARILLGQAMRILPAAPKVLAVLGELELEESNFTLAIEYLSHALALGAGDAKTPRYLASAYECIGQIDASEQTWRRYFPHGSWEVDARDTVLPRLLVLVSPLCSNMQFRTFIRDDDFHVTRFFAESYEDAMDVPDCAAVLVAIANADLSLRALQKARKIVARIAKPCINRPEALAVTGRLETYRRLHGLEGCIVPHVTLMPRNADYSWHELPLLLRVPGYHGGRKFKIMTSFDMLPEILARLPGDELLAIPYIDTRSADGRFRKYRVMSINGRLYPIHLAIAYEWNVHYYSSAMHEHAEFRAEEARFLENMHAVLGSTVIANLEKLFRILDLDYAGIDFSLNTDHEIVVFEANAGMVVVEPDADEKWNYRRPAALAAREAARQMVLERAVGEFTGSRPQ